MKKRYHIQSGEPQPSNGDEREWFVLDRSQVCSRDCDGCPGIVVFVGTTRRAARQECAERNAEIVCQNQTPSASTEQMSTMNPSREALEAMTYKQWLDYHRAQPGGWLTTAAPADLLRATYEQRLVTFDEMNNEA